MSKKTKKDTPQVNIDPKVQELTAEQEIQALRQAHQFFGNFPNVPGFAAAQWGQALDAIAFVANSLISKAGLLEKNSEAVETDQPSA